MRDDGGGALSAITVSSRELVVRGAAGAGLCHGRAAAQLQRAGLLAHELLGLLHPCVCVWNARGRGFLRPLQKAIPTSSRWPAPPGSLSLLGLPHAG